MAKTTTIGNLRAELTLNSKKFEKGIDRSKKKLAGLNKGFGALKGALAGILSAGLLVKLTKNALSFADAIGKSAERIGITTDRLQELRFAFDRAGVSAEIVDKGLLNFGKRLGKANDGFGALAEGLKRTDKELLKNVLSAGSMEKSLDAIFEAMGNATSQAQKLAIADAAFGKAGLLMTAAFDDANRTFERSIELGRSLGIVLDKDLIVNAQKTNDTLSALAQVLKIQFFDLLLRLSPLIGETAQALIDMAKALQKVAGSFNPAIGATEQLKEKIKELKAELKGEGGISFSDILGGKNIKSTTDRNAEIKQLQDILKARESLDFSKKKSSQSSEKSAEQIFNEGKAVEKVIGDQEEAYQGLFTAAEMVSGQLPKLAKGQEELNEVFRSAETPLRRVEKQLATLQGLFTGTDQSGNEGVFGFGDIGDDDRIAEFQAAQEILQDRIQAIKDQTKDSGVEIARFFQGIGDDFGSFIFDVVTQSESALDGLRNFAKNVVDDILSEFIRAQIVKPFVGAATSGLGGIASSLFGFAHGGQFTVGGQGGIDSNLVAFKATRGERVTVETPGQQRGGGSSSVSVSVNMTTGLSQSIRAEVLTMVPGIVEAVKFAVIDAQERNQLEGAF